MIRRKTFERILADRDRAHRAEQAQLLTVISDQNDRIMLLAGSKYAATPLDLEPVAVLEPDDDEPSIPDPDQLPDDGHPAW